MKKKLLFSTIISILLVVNSYVFAFSLAENTDYTEAYKKYIGASDVEKSLYTVIPNKYVYKEYKNNTNPIRTMNLLGASNDKKYSLKDEIPNSVIIKDQKNLNICWGFATLSSLATNLGLKNKSKKYDFSVRHMDYASVKDTTEGNNTNPYGLNRAPGSMATWGVATNYLTNGLGAIYESEMPLNYDTSLCSLDDLINHSNKTEVYDLRYYSEPTTQAERDSLITDLKSNIKLHGAVCAQICGANLTKSTNEYYNPETGAIYYPTTGNLDHAVAIIGWDDDYSSSNFNSSHRPSQNGAWIIQNSWGTNVGDNGLTYISYYDANIYKGLIQITNAADKEADNYSKKYDNIYMHDRQGLGTSLKYETGNQIYLGNKFRAANKDEEINMISLVALDSCKCTVYVNNESSELNNFKFNSPVTLKSGNTTEEIDSGFHMLEFAEPIKINSENGDFSVIVHLEDTASSSEIPFFIEKYTTETSLYNNVDISNKCYFYVGNFDFLEEDWINLGTEYHADNTLRAYTMDSEQGTGNAQLTGITISTPPTKTNYYVGDDFSKEGMLVLATYSDGSYGFVENYIISYGSNLQKGQTSVTITYGDFTAIQPITVSEVPSDPGYSNTIPDPDTIVATNSNLSNLNCTVEQISNNNIKVKVNNFTQNKSNDSMEYSFYVSNTKLQNMSDAGFIKISNPIINSNNMEFNIYSTSLDNLSELDLAKTTYLYLKEVATNGVNSSVAVSNAMDFAFSNSSGSGQSSENNNNSGGNNSSNSGFSNRNYSYSLEDDTVAKDPIPQTGVKSIIIIISLVSIIGTILLVRYIVLRKQINGK